MISDSLLILLEAQNGRFNNDMRESDRIVGTFRAQLNNTVTGLNSFSNQFQTVANRSASLRIVGTNITAVGDAITDIGKKMSILFTLPFVAAIGTSIKEAMKFEEAMSSVKAISLATGDKIKDMRSNFLELANTTQYTAVEVADAATELMKAGVNVAEVTQELPGALSLAAAGEMQLTEAAELASVVLNTFKKDNLSVADSADILAGVANATAATMNGLRMGLQQAGAVAANIEMTFNDTALALGVLAQNGIRGSDAGTSLKVMLQRLQPKTEEQITTFRALGLSAFDAASAYKFFTDKGIKPASMGYKDLEEAARGYISSVMGLDEKSKKAITETEKFLSEFEKSKFFDEKGVVKNIHLIAETLKQAFNNMNPDEIARQLHKMFGTDAIRVASIFYREGSEGTRKWLEETKKTTALDVAREKLNNLVGSLKLFKSVITTSAILVGSMFLPTLQSAIDFLKSLVLKFNNLSDNSKKVILAILAIAAAIPILVIGFGSAITAIGVLGIAFSTLASIVGTIGLPIIAALGGIAIALGALTVAGISIGAFILYVEELREKAVTAFNHLKDAVSESIDIMKAKFEVISPLIQSAIDWFSKLALDTGVSILTKGFESLETVIKNIVPAVEMVCNMIVNFINSIKQNVAVFETIKAVIAVYFEAIEKKGGAAFSALAKNVIISVQSMISVLALLLVTINNVVVSIETGMRSIRNIGQTIQGMIDVVKYELINGGNDIFQTAKSIGEGIISHMSLGIVKNLDILKDASKKMLSIKELMVDVEVSTNYDYNPMKYYIENQEKKAAENVAKRKKDAMEAQFKGIDDAINKLIADSEKGMEGLEKAMPLEDIEAAKKAESALEKRQREIEQFYKSLTDEVRNFTSALVGQADAFANFVGIFENVDHSQAISAKRMMNRIKGQVNDLNNWKDALANLYNRGMNPELVDYLRSLGPSQMKNIDILSKQSDEFLKQYESLYMQKMGIGYDEALKYQTARGEVNNYVTIELSNNRISRMDDLDWVAENIVQKLKALGIAPK